MEESIKKLNMRYFIFLSLQNLSQLVKIGKFVIINNTAQNLRILLQFRLFYSETFYFFRQSFFIRVLTGFGHFWTCPLFTSMSAIFCPLTAELYVLVRGDLPIFLYSVFVMQ